MKLFNLYHILSTNKVFLLALSLVLIHTVGFSNAPKPPMSPTGLMIENHSNDTEPVLISDDQPEFSWIVNDNDANEIQTAYQIIIASSKDDIDNDKGSFYNSKKIKSKQSINIRYQGPSFVSGNMYFWKIRTWDRSGNKSSWSKSGTFVKALAKKDWYAKPIWSKEDFQYTFLRKQVTLENKEIVSALAFVTGRHTEGKYPRPVVSGAKQFTFKFYVNEELIGIGPYRYRGANQYVLFDITDKLKIGEPNVFGSINKSTRQEKDFLCQIKIVYKDGTSQNIITDESWKALSAQNVFNPVGNTSGQENNKNQYYFNPYEEIDGRRWPKNWKKTSFNDSKWNSAILKPEYEIRPGQIRNIRVQKIPIEVKRINDTDYEIVANVHTCGWLELKLEDSPKNNRFTVFYPEEEKDAKALTWVTGGGNESLEEFGYVWRKNIIIKGYNGPELTPKNIDYYVIGAAFNHQDTKFTSSNDLLNDIFRVSKNSMEYNNIDIYMDSPTRQRSPFPGDGIINMRTHYSMSRDYGVGKYSMEYFLPMMYAHYPEYGVQIIEQAYIDYMFTGSTKFIETYYENLQNREDKDGNYLYNGEWIGKDALVDHPNGYKDGYDYSGSPDNVVHSWSYGALKNLAKIAEALGKENDKNNYNKTAEELNERYNAVFWNNEKGIYRDGGGSNHYSIHANFYPTVVGLVSKEKQKSVADFLRTKPLSCNVYGAQFFWDALYKMNEGEKAMQLLLSKDTRSYYNMIHVMKSTTTAETWDLPHLTRSHPWGSAGGNLIVGSVMGVHAIEPGFSKIGVKPQTADLQNASLDFMCIRGNIHMDFVNKNNKYELKIKTPVNSLLKVYVPVFNNQSDEVIVNGTLKKGRREGSYIIFDNLGSGTHTFLRNKI